MTVTEAAAAKIKQLMAEEEDVNVLRVAIQGGGCSGFQYGLGFDRGAAEGDLEFEMHGVQVVVDPFSAPYLKGAEVDYVDSIQAAGLRDQQPERQLVLRLWPLLPGGRGRSRRQRRRLRLRLLRLTLLASRLVSGPLRVAVVGSGPAGFYAAGALLDAETPIEVDMIERLPTPWGLVRLGVAPDHPKLKTVSRAFERIALKPGFRFFGNVEVGRDLTHADLTRLYDAVIYAFGAQSDRRLGIPGEDLPGSWSATEFVAWYNGHPDFQELRVRPERRARGRDRQRQRRPRRRPDARADAGGARADGHDRPGDRGDRRRRRFATSSSSAAAARPRPRGRPRS